MRFKIFSTEVYISYIFMICIVVVLSTDKTGLFLPVIVSILVHELAHLFAMWLLNCEPKQIKFIPGSIQIVRKFTFKKNGEIYISLAGPITNFMLFSICFVHYGIFKSEMTLNFAAINLILGLFNILPVRGLDGGVVLYNILCNKADCRKAEKTLNALTLFFSLTAFATAIILFISGTFNVSLLLLGLYFLLCLSFKI